MFLNINQSLDAIRANLLRVTFTIIIIAFGITALVVVHTSIEGMKDAMTRSFSTLGTNTFSIKNRASGAVVIGRRSKRIRYPAIEFDQAMEFKKRFEGLAPVSLNVRATGIGTVRYQTNQTNPSISVIGTDENYLKTARYLIEEGRSISQEDIENSRKVVVLGDDIKQTLFPTEKAVGKKVTIDNTFYTVIGVYQSMGSAGSSGGDKLVTIPVSTLRTVYPSTNRSFTLNVYAPDINRIDYLMEEATGTFRLIRKRRYDQENDFSLTKSDAKAKQLMENLSFMSFLATAIAFITLLGAAVALFNVMLVSVTERTQEIGVRKAMGATKNGIMIQFMTEAIVICQLGSLTGILLGLTIGNVVTSLVFNGGFVIPWLWLLVGVIACLVVGVVSGAYPAWKAAKVDPIESLRHE